jgi:hypothetical protein
VHARGISFLRTWTGTWTWSWKESADPDKDAKLDRIEYVTSRYPDRCFGFGQFGPLSIRPCHGGLLGVAQAAGPAACDIPPQPRHPVLSRLLLTNASWANPIEAQFGPNPANVRGPPC